MGFREESQHYKKSQLFFYISLEDYDKCFEVPYNLHRRGETLF